MTFHAGTAVTVNPGVRYTDIRRKGHQFAYGTQILSDVPTNQFDAFLLPVFGAVTHDFALSAPESHTMPQLIVSYAPTPEVNVFARYVQGAKTGGLDFNYGAGDPNQASFKAEKVTDYEIGIKGELLDGNLNLALTAFHSKYKDLQLSICNVNRFVLSNAGGQLSKGLELDTTWRTPVDGLTVGASGAYLDAHYTDFKGATCTLEQAFTRPAPCTQDLTGSRSGFSSKWYGSLFAQYSRTVADYAVDLTLDGNYRSRYSPTTNNDPVGEQDANTILNARAQIGPADGPWHLAVFGRNLTNEIYSNFYSANGSVLTPGVSLASLERTRQYGMEFGIRF
jgi:iron complex outermembrane receptor protein